VGRNERKSQQASEFIHNYFFKLKFTHFMLEQEHIEPAKPVRGSWLELNMTGMLCLLLISM